MLQERPVLFLSHGGGPCFFFNRDEMPMMSEIDKNSPTASFLRSIGPTYAPLDNRPRAILVVSAHWEENQFAVGFQEPGTHLLYDYYGFPEASYAPSLTWPANSDDAFAEEVVAILKSSFGPKGCSKVSNRGFDHGVFVPLKLAFPEADIPVLQVSLRHDLDFEAHLRLGEALSPLRRDNVLIVCSGQATHNLRDIMSSGPGGGPDRTAVQFTEWINRVISEAHEDPLRARAQLRNMMEEAPHALKCHPRTEHLVPLLVAFGAGFPPSDPAVDRLQRRGQRIHQRIVNGCMSLDSYEFSFAADATRCS